MTDDHGSRSISSKDFDSNAGKTNEKRALWGRKFSERLIRVIAVAFRVTKTFTRNLTACQWHNGNFPRNSWTARNPCWINLLNEDTRVIQLMNEYTMNEFLKNNYWMNSLYVIVSPNVHRAVEVSHGFVTTLKITPVHLLRRKGGWPVEELDKKLRRRMREDHFNWDTRLNHSLHSALSTSISRLWEQLKEIREREKIARIRRASATKRSS